MGCNSKCSTFNVHFWTILIMAENKHPHKTRQYTGPTQFFHNFEHDPLGRTHCKGPPSNPYSVRHVGGKNVINRRLARGHGRGNKAQWFEFKKKLGNKYLLSSGVPIKDSEARKALGRKRLNA